MSEQSTEKPTSSVTRVDLFRAARSGAAAKASGHSSLVCPFDVSGDLAQRWKARWWLHGWVKGSRLPDIADAPL